MKCYWPDALILLNSPLLCCSCKCKRDSLLVINKCSLKQPQDAVISIRTFTSRSAGLTAMQANAYMHVLVIQKVLSMTTCFAFSDCSSPNCDINHSCLLLQLRCCFKKSRHLLRLKKRDNIEALFPRKPQNDDFTKLWVTSLAAIKQFRFQGHRLLDDPLRLNKFLI